MNDMLLKSGHYSSFFFLLLDFESTNNFFYTTFCGHSKPFSATEVTNVCSRDFPSNILRPIKKFTTLRESKMDMNAGALDAMNASTIFSIYSES